MNEYGEAIGPDAVRIERVLPGPIERVWAYLTESEKRGQWLASGNMELHVGGKVQLNFLHASLTPHQEPIPARFKSMECGAGFEGTVTQCEPPRLLSYTWDDGRSDVRFELTPQRENVLLVITHTRLRDRDEMTLVASGWHTHLGILEDNLLEQTPRPFWSTFERVEVEYKRRLISERNEGREMMSKGEVSSVKCLTFRRLLPGSIERVWMHLTDTTLLPAWFGEDSSIEGRQGGVVRLMGGHIRGVVTQWQPPKKLVYTWNVFEPNDKPDAVSAYPESYLTFELEACEGNEVALNFTHFPLPERFVPQSAMGWHTMLDILATALNGRVVDERSAYMRKNAELYHVDLNNLAQ